MPNLGPLPGPVLVDNTVHADFTGDTFREALDNNKTITHVMRRPDEPEHERQSVAMIFALPNHKATVAIVVAGPEGGPVVGWLELALSHALRRLGAQRSALAKLPAAVVRTGDL